MTALFLNKFIFSPTSKMEEIWPLANPEFSKFSPAALKKGRTMFKT